MRRHSVGVFGLVCLVGMTMSCGDETKGGGKTDIAGDATVGEVGDIGGEVPVDGTVLTETLEDSTEDADDTAVVTAETDDADGDVEEAEIVTDPCILAPGSNFCPCDTAEDCFSSYCIPSRAGDICSRVCEENCPDGYSCEFVTVAGGDGTNLCVDRSVNLCSPCRANADCQGNFGRPEDRCVTFGPDKGSFCGMGCGGAGASCPAGFACVEMMVIGTTTTSKQCVPADRGECTCSPHAIDAGASTACNKNACVGSRVCAEGGLTACDARDDEAEACDGVDNNCNGATDENFPNLDGDNQADCVDADDDNDGIDDVPDNCPAIANPGQEDSDEDGQGDACDKPGVPTVTATDPLSPANDNAPAVLGRAEVGLIVGIHTSATCDGAAVAAAASAADGTFRVAVSVADDSNTTFWAKATDPRNNQASDCSSTSVSYIEDSTAPPAPTLSRTDPVSPSRATAFNVLGQAEARSRVLLYKDAACTDAIVGAEGAAGNQGNFSLPVAVAADSGVTVYATAVDGARNASVCSQGLTYTNDSTAPQPPIFKVTIPESPSYQENRPVLVGQSEPSTQVALYTNPDCSGDPVTTENTNVNGIFTIVTTVDPNSVTTFYGTATDAAKNTSACSPEGIIYIHDDKDPSAPALLGTRPPNRAGDAPCGPTCLGNSITPTVFGTAEPQNQVRLYRQAGCAGFLVGETHADDTGAWTLDVIVAANATTYLYGQETDLAGRVSVCTPAPLAYTHDGIAPARPVLGGTDPRSPSSEPLPNVVGEAEADALVTLYLDETCVTPAGVTGTATGGLFAIPLAVSPNAITSVWAMATDAAQNASPCSITFVSYRHDDIAPERPVLLETRPDSPASVETPAVLGTGEPEAQIILYDNATCTTEVPLGDGFVDTAGGFVVDAMVAVNATTTLYATAIDQAGNVSPCSTTTLAYTHDDDQPIVPMITGAEPASPNNDSATPLLKGTAEAGNNVRIHKLADCSDAPLATATAVAGGTFEKVVTVGANTTTTFYVDALDAAQNLSPCSPQGFTYTHDDKPPPTPAITGTSPVSPNNDSTSPTLTGTAERGTRVDLFADVACTGDPLETITATDAGTFSATVAATANATTTYYALSTDAAGNGSPCSAGRPYIHDAAPPAAPTLTATDPATIGATTSPAVVGSAEAATSLLFYAGDTCTGSPIGSGTTAANGSLRVTVGVGPDALTHIRAIATDAAGNPSPCSSPIDYTNDSTGPVKPLWRTPNPTEPASPNNTAVTPSLYGSAEAGTTVKLFTNAACTGAATTETPAAAGTGAFTFSPTVGSPSSSTDFYVQAYDAVQNPSPCSDKLTYVFDSVRPNPPTITASNPVSPRNVTTPKLSGSVEVNGRLTVWKSLDPAARCAGAAISTLTGPYPTGAWTNLSVTVDMNTTTYFTAKQTDLAGNVSDCMATPFQYRHDNLKPNPPVLTSTVPASPSSDGTPDVKGTVDESDLTVKLYKASAAGNCGVLLQTIAAAPLSWTAANVANANLNNTTVFYATATDRATNVSDCSPTSLSYAHDDSTPNPPTLATSPVRRSKTDHSPTVSGTTSPVEPAGTVTIYDGAGCTGTSTTTALLADGTFSKDIELGTADIDVNFSATVTDPAGNPSACSNSVQYTYDQTAPLPPTSVTFVANSITTTAMTPQWTAAAAADTYTAAANMLYAICRSELCDASDCDFANLADAKYTVTASGGQANLPATGLTTNRRYYFRVRAIDEAGNMSTTSSPVGTTKTLGVNGGWDLYVGEKGSVMRLSNSGTRYWGSSAVPATALALPLQYSLGSTHNCAVLRDGGARCWGENTYGQLGNANTTSYPTTAQIVAIPANTCGPSGSPGALACMFEQVDTGLEHTCGLLSDGTVRCWGRDVSLQLGNGSAISDNQSVPVKVSTDDANTTPLDNVLQIAIGDNFGCALRQDGTVWCWGANGSGQLGLGGTDFQPRAYAVQSSATDLTQIVAGQEHVCGIKGDGTVLCWGYNLYGELGNGTTPTNSPTPVAVSSLAHAVSLGTSRVHTCAVLADGTAKCWGRDSFAECGAGTAVAAGRGTPVTVAGLGGIVQIGGGDGYTCARLADGTARCWGRDTGDRLGNGGSDADSPTPVDVPLTAAVAGIFDVSLDHEHGCAVASDGVAKCWGRTNDGQLGGTSIVNVPGTTTSAAYLTLVASGAAERVRGIETGWGHSCYINQAGALYCWGQNTYGQLGLGSTTPYATPQQVTAVSNVKQVALGEASTCALIADGTVRCWGRNGGTAADGRLIPGSATLNVTSPTLITGLGAKKIRALAVGKSHQCAVDTLGVPYCWGINDLRQVDPQSATTGAVAPTAVRITVQTAAGPPAVTTVTAITVSQIAAGDQHSCGVLADGRALCWGSNAALQTGLPGAVTGTPYVGTPASGTAGILYDAVGLTSQGRGNCVVRANGTVNCWGADNVGALGNASGNANSATPTVVAGILLSGGVTTGAMVSGGDDNGCASTITGAVYCWGDNASRALQNGNLETTPWSSAGVTTCLP